VERRALWEVEKPKMHRPSSDSVWLFGSQLTALASDYRLRTYTCKSSQSSQSSQPTLGSHAVLGPHTAFRKPFADPALHLRYQASVPIAEPAHQRAPAPKTHSLKVSQGLGIATPFSQIEARTLLAIAIGPTAKASVSADALQQRATTKQLRIEPTP